MKFLIFILMLSLSTVTLSAEATFFSLGYMPVNVSEDIAQNEGIDTKAKTFDFGIGGRLDHIRGDLYFGLALIEDNESFTQTVVNNGSIENAESSAGGVYFAVEAGPSYTLSILTVDLMAGWSKFLVSRSISNCMDCNSENISIPSSLYLKPQVIFTIPGTHVGASVAYELMTSSSGLDNTIRFGLTYSGGV